MVKASRSLTRLGLQEQRIGNAGIQAIARVVPASTSLQVLNLAGASKPRVLSRYSSSGGGTATAASTVGDTLLDQRGLSALGEALQHPLAVDRAAAMRYTELAAERGVVSAMAAAAYGHRHGVGVEVSATKSTRFYQSAIAARYARELARWVQWEPQTCRTHAYFEPRPVSCM